METLSSKSNAASEVVDNFGIFSPLASMENLEPRLMMSGSWDNVSEIFLEQCTFYHPDMPSGAGYSWELGFETTVDSVDSARFRPQSITDGWVSITDVETGPEGEEWFYEIDFTDPLEMNSYITETFVLELSFADGNTLSTTLSLVDGDGQALAAPTDVPTITSQSQNQTNIALDSDITWESIVDPNINSICLELEKYLPTDDQQSYDYGRPREEVLDLEFADTSVVTTGALSLDADTSYAAYLLFDNAYTGTTADGVDTFVTRCAETVVEFNTYSSLLDPIDEVYFIRGTDGDTLYGMEFGFESAQSEWFEYARMKTPTGQWYELMVENHYEGDSEAWFEFMTSDQTALEDGYPAGVYELEIDFGNFIYARTSFDVSDPEQPSGNHLPIPTQVPVITSPTYGETAVATDATITWETVTDATVDMIELEVDDNYDNEIIDVELTADQVSYSQALLDGGTTYNAELSLWNAVLDQTNPDGVTFAIGAFTTTDAEFTTDGTPDPSAAVLANINDVTMEVGEHHLPDGSSEYEMRVILGSDTTGWFDTAEISTDGNTWIALDSDYIEPVGGATDGGDGMMYYSWSFAAKDANLLNLAPYMTGQYMLRFTLGDQSTVTTNFNPGTLSMGLTEAPVFTDPVNGQTDVSIHPSITWQTPTDTSINDVRCEIYDGYGHFMLDVIPGYSMASLPADMSLSSDMDYSAVVTFAADDTTQYNDDNVPFRIRSFQSSEVGFTTEANALSKITEICIDQGSNYVDGSYNYWFEFGFESGESDWFTSARMQSPDGNWHALTTEDQGAGAIEAIFELTSTNDIDLAGFGEGTYTLEVTLTGGEVVSTDITVSSVATPDQSPSFYSPWQGQTGVAPDAGFSWSEIYGDSNVSRIDLIVKDDSGNEILDESFGADASGFSQNLLSEYTNYTAELYFVAEMNFVNGDGITVVVARSSGTASGFTTGSASTLEDPIGHITNVEMNRGYIQSEYDDNYVFEFAVTLDARELFDTVEISPDGYSWFSLYEDYEGGSSVDGDQDGPITYIFSQYSTVEDDLSIFGDGTYTLRFTQSNLHQSSTTFEVSGLSNGVTQAPVFTAPLDGATDFAADGSFSWEAVTDANVNTIELETLIDGYTTVFKASLASDATSYTPLNSLVGGLNYSSVLTFSNAGSQQNNSDSIPFTVGTYQSQSANFTAVGEIDYATLIDEVYFDLGQVKYEANATESGQVEYEYFFEFGLETSTPGWLSSATLTTPGQENLYLMSDYSYEAPYEYYAEIEDTSAEMLGRFGPGTYTLEIYLTSGESETLTFDFPTGLAIPDEYPQLTSPADGSDDIPTSGQIQWNEATDADVDVIFLELEEFTDYGYGEWVEFEDLAADATSVDYSDLNEASSYLAEIEFVDGVQSVSVDGINVSTGMISSTVSRFNTYDSWTKVYNVDVNRGVETRDDGTYYTFDVEMGVDDLQWLSSASVTTPAGSSLPMSVTQQFPTDGGVSDVTGGMYGLHLETSNPAEAASFGPGKYTLTLNLADGTTKTTDFYVDEYMAEPTQTPNITSPVSGATDVEIAPTFTWDAVTDSNVTDIWLDFYGENDQYMDSIQLTGDQTSYQRAYELAFNNNYRVKISFAVSQSDNNEDGVFVNVANTTSSEISFTTLLSNLSVTENINGMEFWFGDSQAAGAGSAETALLRLFSDQGDWVDSIEVSTDGSNWLGLMHNDMGSYGHSWELISTSLDSSATELMMRFNLPGGGTESTSFEISTTGLTSPAMGEFTSITDSTMSPDTPISWADPGTDVTNTELLILDSEGAIVDRFGGDLSQLSYEGWLEPNTDYVLVLRHYGTLNDQANDDGLGYRYGAFSEYSESITTTNFDNVWKMVEHFSVSKGQIVAADGSVTHLLHIDLGSPYEGWLVNAWAKAAAGAAFNDAHKLSQLELEDEEDGHSYYSCTLEIESDDVRDLAEFNNGTWWLRLETADGIQQVTMTIDTIDDVSVETPVITSPANDAVNIMPFSPITWEPITDTNVSELLVRIEDADGNVVVEEDLPADATSYTPVGLDVSTTYNVMVVALSEEVDNEHDEGFSYSGNGFMAAEVSYTTAATTNVWDLISNVEFERSENGFEILLSTPVEGWFATAELQDLAGNWHQLQLDGNDDGGDDAALRNDGDSEYCFYVDIDALNSSDFGAGTYNLRITLGSGESFTTAIEFDSQLAAPTQTPVFASPSNNATEVPMATQISWAAVTDSNIDAIWLEIEGPAGEVLDVTLPATATSYDVTLPGGQEYEVRLTFVNSSGVVTNSDGVSVANSWMSEASISFETESPMAAIEEVYVDQGISYTNALNASYVFEIGFDALDDMVTAARLQQIGTDSWITLGLEVEEGPADSWVYETASSNAADIASWTDASWLFEFTFANGQIMTTSVAQADSQSGGAPLVQPTEIPTFTNLYDGYTAATYMDLQWALPTSGNITDAELEFNWLDTDGNENSTDYDIASDQSMMSVSFDSDAMYHASMLWDNARTGQTSDGVDFFVTKYVENSVEFNTYTSVFYNVSEIEFDMTETTLLNGNTVEGFEFSFGSTDMMTVNSAALVTPSGQRLELSSSQGEYFEQWSYVSGTDVSAFTTGDYTLEIVTDDVVARTLFTINESDIPQLSASPNITTPANGSVGIRPNVTFEWDSAADSNIYQMSLTVSDSSGTAIINEEYLSSYDVSYTQSALDFGQTYTTEFVFGTGNYLMSDLGISFNCNVTETQMTSFSTAKRLTASDLLDDVYIERGQVESPASATLDFEFGFGLLTKELDQFTSASIMTPTGAPYSLQPVSASDPQAGYEWVLDFTSQQSLSSGFGDGNMSDFVGGVYTLTMVVNDLETVSTNFLLDASIISPTTPSFTAPLAGAADVSSDVRFEWDAITDASDLALVVTDTDSGLDVINQLLDPFATRYAQSVLAGGGSYQAELLAANGYANLANSDGVDFSVSMYSGQRIEFLTIEDFDPIGDISNVSFDKGFVNDGGSLKLAFDFKVDIDNTQLASARLQSPDGQWYSLTGDGGSWTLNIESATAADLAGFTSGFYTLELSSSASQVVKTTFEVGGLQTPLPITITSPLAGQSDFDSTAAVSWTPSTSASVTAQQVTLIDPVSGDILQQYTLDAAASSYDFALDYESDYVVEIASLTDGTTAVNDDGVSFNAGSFSARRVSFSTAAEFDPIASITSASVSATMINPVDTLYSAWFVLDVHLDMADDVAFENLEYQVDGSWLPAASSDTLTFATSDMGVRDALLGSGSLTLRITHSGGQTTETTLPLPSASSVASPDITVTAPTGTVAVMPDADITWTTSSSNDTMVAISEGSFSEIIDNVAFNTVVTAGGTSVTPQGLEYLSDYTLYIGNTDATSATSGDGIAVSVNAYSVKAIEFSTVEASVDLVAESPTLSGLTAEALWGDSGSLDMSIVNYGTSTASGTATVNVYLSLDDYADGSDILIGTTQSVISLASAASENISVNLAIPQDVDPGSYSIIAVVTTDQSIVEDSVTNNEIIVASIDVDAPVVDLTGEITDIAFDDDGRVIAGMSGVVVVDIVNDGNIAASGNCTVDIYASTSSTFDAANATLIGSRATTLTLVAAGSSSLTVPVDMPSNAAGGYYYFYAVVDSRSQIAESSEDNNVAVWDAPVAIEEQVVDFTGVITTHSFGAATLGGTIGDVDITLINQGNWPIRKNIAVQLYASATGEVDTQAISIGQGTARLNLEADGASQDVSFRVKLPSDIADGDYYIVAVVDSAQVVDEQNEFNNTLLSDTPISIVAPFVDISGDITTVSYGEAAIAGESGEILIEITNNGNIKARQNGVLVNLYASTTLNIDDGVLISSQNINVNIDAGGSREFKFRTDLPEDMATGFYYIIADIDADADSSTTGGQIDESSEMNNTAIAESQLEVQEQMIDLVATIGESTLHSSPMPGMGGRVEVIIANQGNVPSGGDDVTIKIYGSIDSTADASEDMLLGEATIRRMNLRAGETRTQLVNVTVPEGAASDIYNMIVVVDTENAVTESVEDNNSVIADDTFSVVEPFVDISTAISEVTLPDSVLPGDSGRVTVMLTNDGNIPARGDVTITIYASDSSVKDAGTEVELATMDVRVNLSAGASRDYTANVIVPEDVEDFSSLYLIAVATPATELEDTDATNNVASNDGPVLEDPVRDLTGELVSFDLPGTVIAGDRGSARIQVANNGNIPASGEIEIGIYAVATDTPGATPILIGEAITDDVTIAPQRSLQYNFRFTLGEELTAGVDYQFYVDIDTTDVVDEVDETNNTLDLGDPVSYVQRFGSFEGHRNEALTLTDNLGQDVQFQMTGDGYGEITTDGNGLFVVTLSDTASNSRFVVRTDGNETTSVSSITADGDLGSIDAESVNLADGGSVSIAGSLGQMRMNNIADQHTLDIGGDGSAKVSIEFNDVTDLTITSATPIQSLEVNSWNDTDGDDMITAPWIGSLSSRGDFDANLTLSGVGASGAGTLGRVSITGSVTDGDDSDQDWQITGDIGTIDIAGNVDDLDITAASVKALILGDADGIDITTTGDIASIRATSIADGSFDASAIKNITVDDSFGADITLSSTDAAALGSVKAGSLDYTDSATASWDIAGGVGGVVADTIDNLRIEAAAGVKSIVAGDVTDASLGSQSAGSVGDVTLLRADSWTGGEIFADSVTNVLVGGDFSADMTVGVEGEAAFKTVRIDGGITGGTWTISGDMGALTVGGDLSGWTLDLGDAALKSFRLGSATDTSISAGEIGTIVADGWDGGTITADSVRSVSIGGDADIDMAVSGDVGNFKASGDMTGGSWTVGGEIKSVSASAMSDVDMTADIISSINIATDVTDSSIAATHALDARTTTLNKLNVRGALTNSSVRTVGNMGNIVVGKMDSSVVFAGVSDSYATDENSDGVLDLPVLPSDFNSPDADVLAQIKSISVKGSRDITGDLFTNSSIAAGSIGKAQVTDVTLDNGSQAFGISAVDSMKVIWQQGRDKYVFGRSWAADDGDFTVTIAEDAPGQWFYRT